MNSFAQFANERVSNAKVLISIVRKCGKRVLQTNCFATYLLMFALMVNMPLLHGKQMLDRCG